MSVIQRKDGTQFVIRCYRETLSLTNINLFKQHAFLISEMHGYFAKFLPGRSSKSIESIFSNDAGFLCAEILWEHFGKPDDMIFCEKLNNNEFLTVIVRNNLIYTDGVLPPTELQEELAAASISLGNAPIYLHGDIPGFIPPKDLAADPPLLDFNQKNVEHLEQSVFNEIAPDPNLEVVPIQQAVSDLQLSKASRRNIISVLFLVFVFAGGLITYYIASRPEPIQQIDPLEGFRDALTSPSPQEKITQASKAFLLLNSIPGWSLGKISIQSSSLTASLNSFGGSAQSLLTWGILNNAAIKFDNAGANITLSLPTLPSREPPAAPYPMQQILAKIIDTSIALSLNKSIELGTISSRGGYSSSKIEIHLSNTTPKNLLLFGLFLNNLPVTVDKISLDTGSALINGSLTITAYGY